MTQLMWKPNSLLRKRWTFMAVSCSGNAGHSWQFHAVFSSLTSCWPKINLLIFRQFTGHSWQFPFGTWLRSQQKDGTVFATRSNTTGETRCAFEGYCASSLHNSLISWQVPFGTNELLQSPQSRVCTCGVCRDPLNYDRKIDALI